MKEASEAYINLIRGMDDLRILSIDFDVILNDCLAKFNDYCDSVTTTQKHWKQIKQKSKVYHFKYSEDLIKLIEKLVCSSEILICCNDHRLIADTLLRADAKAELITNLDFHHDLGYKTVDLSKEENIDDGNWLGHLSVTGKCKKIIEFRTNEESRFDPKIITNCTVLPLDDAFKLDADDYDITYFILSPGWVPPEVRHFYHEIVDKYNKIKLAGVSN